MFSELDPGKVGPAEPDFDLAGSPTEARSADPGSPAYSMGRSAEPADPNAARIRVGLSGIASHQPEAAQKGKAR